VGAADGDRIAEAHEFGQHFGAAHDRQQLFARGGSSGLLFLIAVDTTTTSASPRFSALWPTKTSMPLSRRRCTLALSA
jgi:hypothetical protein